MMAMTGALLLLALGAGCAMEQADPAEVGASESELFGPGVVLDNTYRPEVGWVMGNCTGTLVDDNWFVFAGHCFNFFDQIDQGSSGGRLGTFQITDQFGVARTYQVDTHFALDTGNGSKDVALARLSTSVPSSQATPANIAVSVPTTGNRTDVGYGGFGPTSCSSGSDGQKRRLTQSVTAAQRSCFGDSGGPAFVGNASDMGDLFWVHATFAPGEEGDVTAYRNDINNIIYYWDNWASFDISNNPSWCSGRIMYGDYDGDGHVDAICKDGNTIRVARGAWRMMYDVWASNGSWCTGSGQQLHVGDFNGDGRSDLICWDSDDGRKWIDYSSGWSTTPYASAHDWSTSSGWCSHSGAKLHMGDFNGDGRTDLLCHDNVGRRWIDLASSSGTFDGRSDWWRTSTRWCGHATSRLFTGDFNGDGRTDMLCHTSNSGALDVAQAQTSGALFPAGTSWFNHGIDFCNNGGSSVEVWNGNGDFAGGDETADIHCDNPGAGAARSNPYVVWAQVSPQTERFIDPGTTNLRDGEGTTYFPSSTHRPFQLNVADGFANHL